MKPIQIILAVLTLAYASLKLNAQNPNDTVKVLYKGKVHKVNPKREPDEEESSTTWKFKDTVKKETVLIKVTVKGDDDVDYEKNEDTKKSSNMDSAWKKWKSFKNGNPEKKDKFLRTYFVPSLDIGTASTFHDAGKVDSLSPRMRNSAYISMTFIKQTMNIYKSRFLFSYGIGSNGYFLKYTNRQQVQYLDKNGYVRAGIDSVNHYRKNRLDIGYITVPVMLEYHSKSKKFNMAAGVEFAFNGNTTFVQKGSRNEGTFNQRNNYDVKINPTQMNAVVKVGLDKIALYAKYTLTDMYQASAYTEKTNPHQHLFSVGICLFGI